MDTLATYRLRDVAALLRVSERFVRDELIAGRRIAHLQISPKVVRVTATQLEDFYAEVAVPLAPNLSIVGDLAQWRAA